MWSVTAWDPRTRLEFEDTPVLQETAYKGSNSPRFLVFLRHFRDIRILFCHIEITTCQTKNIIVKEL